MFENFDLSKMGAMIEAVQKQAEQMQEDASKKVFTAKSGGGLVSVSVSGSGEVVDITLDDSLLEDKESLQILLISAMNDAMKMLSDDKALSATQMLSGMGNFGLKS